MRSIAFRRDAIALVAFLGLLLGAAPARAETVLCAPIKAVRFTISAPRERFHLAGLTRGGRSCGRATVSPHRPSTADPMRGHQTLLGPVR